jgi:hypothetical protein
MFSYSKAARSKALWILVLAGAACISAVSQTLPKGKRAAVVSATPTPTRTPRSDQTTFVEGLVFDARTKLPLAGVAVTLEGHDDFFKMSTGADGRYRFAHVAPTTDQTREYAWTASLTGYSSRSVYAVGKTDPQISIPRKGLKLDIALVRSGTVRGVVRDIAGHAIKGADVSIYGVGFDDSDLVRTDAQGRFKSDDLSIPPRKSGQTYSLRVTHSLFSIAGTHVVVKPKYAPGDEASVRLTMKPRALISGRLMFRGEPLRNAYVVAARSGEEDLVTSTDKNGCYSLKVSAPARYEVSLQGDDTLAQQVLVDVTPGRLKVINRNFKPYTYGSITGRIVDLNGRGVKGADIELWTKNTSETDPVATTDARGRFFIAKVRPYDNYSVSVNMPGAEPRGGVTIEPVRVNSYRTTQVFARGDTVPPKLQILSAVPKVLKAGIVQFHLRASDNRGLRYVYLDVDGESASAEHEMSDFEFGNKRAKARRRAEAILRWDTRTVPNGQHKLDFVLWDLVGNKVTRSFKVWVQGSPFKTPQRPKWTQSTPHGVPGY